MRAQFLKTAAEPDLGVEPKKVTVKNPSSKSQSSLLAGAIKRKVDSKPAETSSENGCSEAKIPKVLGVLPGLGGYDSDSSECDSDGSTDDEEPVVGIQMDLLGRPIVRQEK